ncbi:MAG TPA: tail fiber domain-containing protein [Pyrinomonadaceae bacterium]|jgi:hypothetical protein
MSTPIRASYPISFTLLNDHDQPVMDILDDSEGRDLKLEITNSSGRDVKLADLASNEATDKKHHFELRFRPGVLNTNLEIKISGGDGSWVISKPIPANGTVSLYLSSKNASTLSAGARLTLTLRNINADGKGGARGTRVELKYQNLEYALSNPAQKPEPLAEGQRIQHMSIVNERGQKHIPLHMGIVGSDTILNNGKTPNARILRITNLLKKGSIPLSATGKAVSKFILSFDVYDSNERNEWALGYGSSVKDIQVDAIKIQNGKEVKDESWLVTPYKQVVPPEWVITPQNKTELEADESIQLKLSNIISQNRSGQATVYLRYENIYGYWDGQFTTSLEKSHLIHRDQLNPDETYTQESYIGIGTDNPKSKLHVVGNTVLDGKLSVNSGDVGAKPSVGVVNISEATGTPQSANGGSLVFDHENRGGASSIVFRSKENRGSDYAYIQYQDDATMDGTGESSLLTIGVENDAQDHLILKPSGNVGIGTTTPTEKLDVRSSGADVSVTLRVANADATGFINLFPGRTNDLNPAIIWPTNRPLRFATVDSINNSAATNWLEKVRITGEGRVGIGTDKPATDLVIFKSASGALGPILTLYNNSGGSGAGAAIDFNGTAVGDNDSTARIRSLDDGSHSSHLAFYTKEPGAPNKSLKERVRIKSDGSVGIGTNSPTGRLNISEDSGTVASPSNGTIVIDHENSGGASSIVFRSKGNRGSDYGYIQYQDAATVSGGGESARFIIGTQNDDEDHLLLKPAGNVGVNIDTPTAPLHVGISRRANHWIKDQYAYLAYTWNESRSNDFRWGLSGREQPQYFEDTSILAEGRVVGKEFNAFSDSRIKKSVSTSDPLDDLNLLKQLRVTDYQFKESLAHGDRYSKGFIAEEVEQFFPQAVNKRSDFIPDIYAFAEETTLNDGVLTVGLKNAHNLSEGDTVRLITEAEGVREVSVSVVDEKTFAVRGWTGADGKLFVHGKRVDDFRTLDYQQIFSLGISGLQQLSKQVVELRAENNSLTQRLQLLESRMEAVLNAAASQKREEPLKAEASAPVTETVLKAKAGS